MKTVGSIYIEVWGFGVQVRLGGFRLWGLVVSVFGVYGGSGLRVYMGP